MKNTKKPCECWRGNPTASASTSGIFWHQQRIDEMVYLANVLTAGAAIDGRTFRRGEAVTAAVTACGLGPAHLVATTGEDAATIFRRDGADLLFRIGWRQLIEHGRDPVRALLGGVPHDRA